MIIEIVDFIIQNVMGIITFVSAVCALFLAWREIDRGFKPKLEINISLPTSAYCLVPLVDGIRPLNFDEEKFINNLQAEISKDDITKTISGVIKTLKDWCLNNPKDIKISIEVNNVGKRTVNLRSFGIFMRSDASGSIKLQEYEIAKISKENEFFFC